MKFGRSTFEPVPGLIGGSAAALAAWGVSRFVGLSFWAALVAIAIAMFINGLMADAEDNAPGGFNNPLPPPGQSSQDSRDVV